MNTADFNTYKTKTRAGIREVLSMAERGSLDEAAFPAYSHQNPAINWLFWQRLRKAMDFLEKNGPYQQVLDFGCGSGVLLPFLAGISKQVVAADLDLAPFQRMTRVMRFPENIELLDLAVSSFDALPEGSFDIITALDVLEHIDDLSESLEALLRLLKPEGLLVVSGPTENIFYRIGRRLAGEEYSGHYHERGIAQIRRELAKRAEIQDIAVLYWPVPLFDLFAAKRI